MTTSDIDLPEIARFDPLLVQRLIAVLKPYVKRWLRSEVRGLDNIPAGGALLVSNHSGGPMPDDMQVLAVDYYSKFGYDRPLYGLAHDVILRGPTSGLLRRLGLIRATRANASAALRSGAAVVVFPGGDYEACRPSWHQTLIDFRGRKGYIKTALEAGVPIVPVVSIGGQEAQLFLGRGMWLSKKVGVEKYMRTDVLPIAIGLPFGLTPIPMLNIPLPTKIVTEVLEPIDVATEFGEVPDFDAVDERIRSAMQTKLNELAAQRRFPVIG